MVQWFFNCTVTLTGLSVDHNRTVVGLTDVGGTFVNRQFIAADSVRKELLATALTALSTGHRVQAALDDGAAEFGTLYALYVTTAAPPPPPPAPRWASLAGVSLGGPAAARQDDGRLVVFVRGDNNRIWYRPQEVAMGDWWDWGEVPGGEFTSDPSAVVAVPGGLVVFARGNDNAIWHAWQDAVDGPWSGWVSLGGVSVGGPAAARQVDGRLAVFIRGENNRIRYRPQAQAMGPWQDWSEVPGGEFTSDAAAALAVHGGLVVFARGTDNAIWHAWQDVADGPWS